MPSSAMALSAHHFTGILAVLLLLGTTLDRIGLPATTSTTVAIAAPTRLVDATENDAKDIVNDVIGDDDDDTARFKQPITFVQETPDELSASLPPFLAELIWRQRHRAMDDGRSDDDDKSGSLADCSTLLDSLIRPSHLNDNRANQRRRIAAAKVMSNSLPVPDSGSSSSSSSSSSSRGSRQRKYNLAVRAASYDSLRCRSPVAGTNRQNGQRRVHSDNSPRRVVAVLSPQVRPPAAAAPEVKRAAHGMTSLARRGNGAPGGGPSAVSVSQLVELLNSFQTNRAVHDTDGLPPLQSLRFG